MHCSDPHARPATVVRARCTTGIAAVLMTALSVSVSAQELGVIGPVYPIAEPSLMEVIIAKQIGRAHV